MRKGIELKRDNCIRWLGPKGLPSNNNNNNNNCVTFNGPALRQHLSGQLSERESAIIFSFNLFVRSLIEFQSPNLRAHNNKHTNALVVVVVVVFPLQITTLYFTNSTLSRCCCCCYAIIVFEWMMSILFMSLKQQQQSVKKHLGCEKRLAKRSHLVRWLTRLG